MCAKGDYMNQVHSDQMVLKIVRWEGLSRMSGGQKEFKGGHQA
jgi:hypothetical protein